MRHSIIDKSTPGVEYPCTFLNQILTQKDLVKNKTFIQKALLVPGGKAKNLAVKNIALDFTGASKNVIKKSLAAVRSETKTVSSHIEDMSLLESFFILIKNSNPEFEYSIERDDKTLEFTYAACTMLGAKNFYDKLLGVIGIDGCHIQIDKVLPLFLL